MAKPAEDIIQWFQFTLLDWGSAIPMEYYLYISSVTVDDLKKSVNTRSAYFKTLCQLYQVNMDYFNRMIHRIKPPLQCIVGTASAFLRRNNGKNAKPIENMINTVRMCWFNAHYTLQEAIRDLIVDPLLDHEGLNVMLDSIRPELRKVPRHFFMVALGRWIEGRLVKEDIDLLHQDMHTFPPEEQGLLKAMYLREPNIHAFAQTWIHSNRPFHFLNEFCGTRDMFQMINALRSLHSLPSKVSWLFDSMDEVNGCIRLTNDTQIVALKNRPNSFYLSTVLGALNPLTENWIYTNLTTLSVEPLQQHFDTSLESSPKKRRVQSEDDDDDDSSSLCLYDDEFLKGSKQAPFSLESESEDDEKAVTFYHENIEPLVKISRHRMLTLEESFLLENYDPPQEFRHLPVFPHIPMKHWHAMGDENQHYWQLRTVGDQYFGSATWVDPLINRNNRVCLDCEETRAWFNFYRRGALQDSCQFCHFHSLCT